MMDPKTDMQSVCTGIRASITEVFEVSNSLDGLWEKRCGRYN